MCAEDGAHPARSAIVAVEEVACRSQKGLHVAEQLAVRDLAPELPPEHLDGIEPRAVSRELSRCGQAGQRMRAVIPSPDLL